MPYQMEGFCLMSTACLHKVDTLATLSNLARLASVWFWGWLYGLTSLFIDHLSPFSGSRKLKNNLRGA
jgi:hypothetical protein